MKKRRNKNEMTKGDKLAQDYRKRAALYRVYESSVLANAGYPRPIIRALYHDPVHFYDRFMIIDTPK